MKERIHQQETASLSTNISKQTASGYTDNSPFHSGVAMLHLTGRRQLPILPTLIESVTVILRKLSVRKQLSTSSRLPTCSWSHAPFCRHTSSRVSCYSKHIGSAMWEGWKQLAKSSLALSQSPLHQHYSCTAVQGVFLPADYNQLFSTEFTFGCS